MNYYNEFDPKAAAWLRELIKAGLIPNGDVDERSIRNVYPTDLVGYTQCHFFAGIGGWAYALKLAGWPESRPVWTGSCPCQPFSCAGKGLAEKDPRHIWPVWFGLIKECRPAIIFGEQVASSVALSWLDGVFDNLESENYACGASDLCAAGVRSPQIRPRLCWVALRSGERRTQPRLHKQDPINYPEGAFREASGLVDAVRRQALPFLCRRHDGLSATVGEIVIKGFGNAIVPQVAAEFIKSFLETE